MAFWERNFIIILITSLIAGGVYFGAVTWTSLQQGAIAAPSILLFMTYIILQVGLAAIAIIILEQVRPDKQTADLPIDGMDERDRFVKIKSESGASHFTSAAIFVAMIAWFWHENGSLFFHSLVAATLFGELMRCVLQIFNYNRAY